MMQLKIVKRTIRKFFNIVAVHIEGLFKQKKSWGCLDLIFVFSGIIDTSETDFDDFGSEFLGEYEAICETVLAC
jgi:hypothetical protein